MATVDLTEETFAGTVRDGIALVDWWAGWCGPCRMFAPVFHAASEQHPDITFGKVDTKAEQQLAALTVSTLGQLIQAVRELDMDDVRRQIAEHAPARSA